MDFREEYKKSAEVMTPSAEAMERMTQNIMEQINAPAKKAIPFKKISYIGGAIAACAVITVGAVKLLPSMQTELATADAAANESVTAVYQDSAAEEEYAPLNGIIAETDGAVDTKTDFAMDVADEAVSESEGIFEYITDANDDTTAVAAPTVSANDGSSLFEDKSIADNADIFAAEEDVMEESETNFESSADAGNSDISQKYPTELIYVADDMQSFTIGNTEYIRFPQEFTIGALPEEKSIAYYMSSDGSQYEITDFGDIKLLTNGDFSAFYCAHDMYNEIINQQQ